MDFPPTSFLLLLGFFIFLIVKIFRKPKKNPPGPWKLPLIGSLHHLGGGDASVLPHHRLRDLAKRYGPIMHIQLGEVAAVVVSSRRLAKEALRNHDAAFSNRMSTFATDIMFYNRQDLVFTPYGDFWRQMRKICVVELLSNKNVRSFSSIREDEVWRLISAVRASAGEPTDMTELVCAMTSAITCRAAFGRTSKDQKTLISLLDQVIAVGSGFEVGDLFPSLKLHAFTGMKARLLKMHRQLDGILEEIIDEHSKNRATTKQGNGESGEEDLIDVLLRLKENGGFDFPITNDNIKGIVFDIFGGGTETSTTTTVWALSEMVKNPRIMKKAQDEVRSLLKGKKIVRESDLQGLSYLKLVVKETFRLHPPLVFLGTSRECREECEVDGYTIPVKTKLIINTWAIGRDPEYWEDPEKFEPERFKTNGIDFSGNHFELLPFGTGKRMCPGMSFGVANVEFPLAQLLYHFDWKLPGGIKHEDLDMTENFGITVGRKTNLRLIATPYNHSLGEKEV